MVHWASPDIWDKIAKKMKMNKIDFIKNFVENSTDEEALYDLAIARGRSHETAKKHVKYWNQKKSENDPDKPRK